MKPVYSCGSHILNRIVDADRFGISNQQKWDFFSFVVLKWFLRWQQAGLGRISANTN